MPKLLLLRPRDVPGPGTQAGPEFVRPLIGRLEDDAPAFPAHHNLAFGIEPALLWEPYRLTSAILEELRSNTSHGFSIYLRLYDVNFLRVPAGAPVRLAGDGSVALKGGAREQFGDRDLLASLEGQHALVRPEATN